ncbi:alginate O-acetyltransferase [Pseudomonas cavernicola]|uniref:Probable alginate O-acetylase AlgJ n=1 Tax=Pseudomonas cavernicola TaxID=2320866 RepID=A0A418XCW4_9PSED|nr:alginate O-acetyltransferase [Pseudomonas cavernicola]RJG10344.1 alginate O-acetyltransferase [Pseudomonas cavernicola]
MTRSLRILYIALFLGLLLGLGAWSTSSFLGFNVPPNTTRLNGHWAKAVESRYDEQFPIKRLGTNLWAALDFTLFGEGRPGVVLGRDNWLFSDEEFKPVADSEQHMQENWQLIQGVRDRLARQNVQLVLAIIPAKARLYPEFIGETPPAVLHRGLYDQFHSGAKRAGIFAPDLLGALTREKRAGQVFLRTDTHWTPRGAEVVAQSLGQAILRHTPLSGEPQAFTTETTQTEPYSGDLTHFLPLDPLFAELLPPPDQLQLRNTEARQADQAATGDALFSEQQVPVALVGTSYSANQRWNFLGALRQALNSEVVNYAEDGHGPILPMLKYLQTDEFNDSPPQLVIWEFPERYLPMPADLSEFDPSWITQLKASGAADERLASTATESDTPTQAMP